MSNQGGPGWPSDGQPNQGPNQPQEPYGQPGGQAGYGAPQPQYGGPPAKKKNTGLIIGGIVGAVLLIGAIVVGGIVLAGGDDDKKDESTSTATDSASDDATDEPTDEPTETDSPDVEDGDIVGTGYSYELPSSEWIDGKDLFAASGTAVDSAAIWGTSLEDARANVLVESSGANGSELASIRDQWETNLKGTDPAPLKRLDDVTIDGEEAYAIERQTTNDRGVEVFQNAYLAIHNDTIYSIAFTTPPGDDEVEAAFNDIKDSWEWTD